MNDGPQSEPGGIISRFEKLLADLARADVDFCVVGGLAAALNGFVRFTEDVDILVHPARPNLERMLTVLRGWGEGWARELTPEDFTVQEGSVRVAESEFDLDIFVQMLGKTLDDFRPRLRHFESDGVRIPYLAPEDLILLKEGSGREKDRWDVAAMREIIARRAAAP